MDNLGREVFSEHFSPVANKILQVVINLLQLLLAILVQNGSVNWQCEPSIYNTNFAFGVGFLVIIRTSLLRIKTHRRVLDDQKSFRRRRKSSN